MDQIVNSAAKWRYMFDGKQNVSLVIRMIVGKGWGQGPTHSQSLHAMFSSIPGLKVVMPHGPNNAKNLLYSSLYDKNPVIFLEHRWLHQTTEHKKNEKKIFKLGQSIKVKNGNDITIVTLSYLVLEAKKIAFYLKENFNISVEVIDLSTLSPNNYQKIIKSYKKTRKILFIDIGHDKCSIMKDVMHKVYMNTKSQNKNFDIITLPDVPIPTTHKLARYIYTDANIIVKKIFKLLKIKSKFSLDSSFLDRNNDTPGLWFKGPF